MSTIQGVLFDYGLVLSGPRDPAAWERMKATLAAGEERFHAAYWQPRHEYDLGTLSSQAYWKAVAEALGRQLSVSELVGLERADVDLWTQPNPEMIGWAAALRASGFHTAILSNLGDAMETGVRERCSWLSGFAHLTFSHRLRLAKPDQAIYRHAADGMGLSAASILFVDDREDNIAAAEAFGMQAIRYADHASFIAEVSALANGALPLPSTR